MVQRKRAKSHQLFWSLGTIGSPQLVFLIFTFVDYTHLHIYMFGPTYLQLQSIAIFTISCSRKKYTRDLQDSNSYQKYTRKKIFCCWGSYYQLTDFRRISCQISENFANYVQNSTDFEKIWDIWSYFAKIWENPFLNLERCKKM